MIWRVEFETRAKREFFDLPKETQQRLVPVIEDLAKHPRPPGAKKLTGQEGFRIRKGDYRLLYTIDDKASLVRIYRIGHRREVYR
mgnify:CR=1 FL=1